MLTCYVREEERKSLHLKKKEENATKMLGQEKCGFAVSTSRNRSTAAVRESTEAFFMQFLPSS